MSRLVDAEYIQQCDAARELFMKHCTGPVPNDIFVRYRWLMCGAHLVYAESMKQMYKLADSITPDEVNNFAIYCYCFTQSITHHHHMEEEILFPKLEPELKTPVSEEHQTFERFLNELNAYLQGILQVKQGKTYGQLVPDADRQKEEYDPAKLKGILETLVSPLLKHLMVSKLMQEIVWLDPENLKSTGLTAEKLRAADQAVGASFRRDLYPLTLGVHAVGHQPPGSEWPAMPGFVKRIIVPYVLYWRYRASWKYLPYRL
ncbi:hypothetical protein CPB86DRAFT_800589 [Serendipita vermifera]|nr:hypothetical protein CPB86DRAFT_800589 [Serendipita vermifera]